MGLPLDVFWTLGGPLQTSWPAIGFCILDIRFQAIVIWSIKKRPELWDTPGERENAWLEATQRAEGNICRP